MNRILQREGDRRRLFLILCILHSDDVNVEKACRLPRPAPAPASPPSTVLPDPSTRRNSDNQWWSRAEAVRGRALIISHPSPFRGKWTWKRIGGLNFNSSSKWFRMKGIMSGYYAVINVCSMSAALHDYYFSCERIPTKKLSV